MEKVTKNLTGTTQNIITAKDSIVTGYSSEALWQWDLKEHKLVTAINLQELFGYPQADAPDVYDWWKNGIHGDDREPTIKKMKALVDSEAAAVQSGTYRFIGKDGSYKYIEQYCALTNNHESGSSHLVVLMRDVTELKRLQRKIEEQEQLHQRQIDLAVMDAQQNERRKLAEELHDNVNQLLGVVKLYIEHSITNENIRDGLLKKSNQYIDKVIEELRNLSKNLAPPLLAELGLEHSLTSLAESIAEVQKINIGVEMPQFDDRGLADTHKLMIYRIVQEQLNNIIKHADAKNVTLFIERKDNKLLMSIEDDGCGAELHQESPNGLGLRNIKNRIELFHGKMEVVTAPGKGFRLNIEFEV